MSHLLIPLMYMHIHIYIKERERERDRERERNKNQVIKYLVSQESKASLTSKQ